MKRVVLLSFVLLALGASVASAHTTINSPNPVYQRWVDESKVPTPAAVVLVVEGTGPCGEVLACTNGTTIYFELGGRKTFFHELGHLTAYLNPELASFLSERFADTYSLCARESGHLNPTWTYSAGAGVERGARIEKACRAITQFLS